MTLPEIVPFITLSLSGIGFILALIADNWTAERRMKIGFILFIMAVVSILLMR